MKTIIINEENKHQFEKAKFMDVDGTLSEGYVVTNKTKMDQTKDRLYMVFLAVGILSASLGAYISYRALKNGGK